MFAARRHSNGVSCSRGTITARCHRTSCCVAFAREPSNDALCDRKRAAQSREIFSIASAALMRTHLSSSSRNSTSVPLTAKWRSEKQSTVGARGAHDVCFFIQTSQVFWTNHLVVESLAARLEGELNLAVMDDIVPSTLGNPFTDPLVNLVLCPGHFKRATLGHSSQAPTLTYRLELEVTGTCASLPNSTDIDQFRVARSRFGPMRDTRVIGRAILGKRTCRASRHL